MKKDTLPPSEIRDCAREWFGIFQCRNRHRDNTESPRSPPLRRGFSRSVSARFHGLSARSGYEAILKSTPKLRNSLFSDIFSPNFRVLRHIFGKHLDAFVGMGVEHFCAVLTQPIDAAAEIHGLADHYGANAKLADQAAAIPARGQRRHHDLVAVTALPARLSKRIGFAVRGRIALLHSAVVATSKKFSFALE